MTPPSAAAALVRPARARRFRPELDRTSPRPDDETGVAARGSILNVAGAATAALAGFVTVSLVTNTAGEAGAGIFFAATATFTLAANASRLGAESGLTYLVARLRAEGRPGAIAPTVRLGVAASALAGMAMAMVGVLAAPALGALVSDGPASAAQASTMIRILALAVPAVAVTQALIGASRGFGTMRPSVLTGQLVRPLAQLVFVLAVVLATDALWPLAMAWAMAGVVTLGPVVWWVGRRLRRTQARAEQQRTERSRPEARPIEATPAEPRPAGRYWRFAGPRAVADLLAASLERLDVLLVAVLVGEAGAGHYGASGRLILAGQLLTVATAQAMAPHLARALGDGRRRDARHLLRIMTGWNVTVLWPIFIVLVFGARTALSVFGPGFEAAVPLVVVLALGFLAMTALGPGDTLLLMTGDSMASLVNHAVALAVLVGVSVAATPTVGAVGVAGAWVASRLILRGLAVWRVRRTTGIHAAGRPAALAAALALTAYGPTGVMAHGAIGSGPGAVAAHVLVGATVHAMLLWRSGRSLEMDRLRGALVRRSGQLSQS